LWFVVQTLPAWKKYNSGGGAIEGKTAAQSRCAAYRLRWTAAAAMGDGGAMGGSTAGHPRHGREMG